MGVSERVSDLSAGYFCWSERHLILFLVFWVFQELFFLCDSWVCFSGVFLFWAFLKFFLLGFLSKSKGLFIHMLVLFRILEEFLANRWLRGCTLALSSGCTPAVVVGFLVISITAQ